MSLLGSDEQIHVLINLKIIEAIVDFMKNKRDADFLELVLECLENILSSGQRQASATTPNVHLLYFEKVGGVLAIQELQDHSNSKIYQKVSSLIDKYFDYD